MWSNTFYRNKANILLSVYQQLSHDIFFLFILKVLKCVSIHHLYFLLAYSLLCRFFLPHCIYQIAFPKPPMSYKSLNLMAIDWASPLPDLSFTSETIGNYNFLGNSDNTFSQFFLIPWPYLFSLIWQLILLPLILNSRVLLVLAEGSLLTLFSVPI